MRSTFVTITRWKRAHTLAFFAALGAGAAGCNVLIGLGGYDFGASSSGTSASGGSAASGGTGGGSSASAGGSGGDTGGTGGGDMAAPAAQWAVQLGDDSVKGAVRVNAVAVNGQNHVFATGRWDGIDEMSVPCQVATKVGDPPYSGFVLELEPVGGVCLWSLLFGHDAEGTGITLDADGHIYLVGNFRGSLALQPSPATPLTAANQDGFVVRLDPAGASYTVKWLRQITDKPQLAADQAMIGVATDAGSVAIAGTTDGSAQIDNNLILDDCSMCLSGFVQRFDTDGTMKGSYVTWADGASGMESLQSVSMGGGGKIAVAGHTDGGLVVTGVSSPLVDAGLFHVVWDTNDMAQAFVLPAHPGTIRAATAFNGNGDSAFAGEFGDQIAFGGQMLMNSGEPDIFLALPGAAGGPPAGVQLGTDQDGQGPTLRGLALWDKPPRAAVAGSFKGQLGFIGVAGPQIDTGDVAVSNGFVASLDASDSSPRWLKQIGDNTASASVDAVAVDHAGKTVIAGSFQGTVDLGKGHTLDSKGPKLAYVTRLED